MSAAAAAIAIALATSAACGRREAVPALVPVLDLAASRPVARATAGLARHPPTATDRPALELSAGTSAAWAFFAQRDSELRGTALALSAGAALEVEIQTDERGRKRLASWRRPREEVRLPLALRHGVPARLILRVTGPPGARAALLAPAVWAAAPAPSAVASPAPRRPPGAAPPNVVVYLIDTLRRDRLGCYGYTRPISPAIDDFASRATVFTHAVAQSSWTKPSVASLFTGVWPPAHGAIGWRDILPGSAQTLPELLSAAGYSTAGFVANPNVVPEFGFEQGFERLVRRLKAPSAELNGLVFDWLDERDDRPFFLYVHTMDPHAPYTPPEPWRSRFAPTADRMPSWRPRWRWPDEALPFLSDLYDAEVAQNDASFGALAQRLVERGLWDSSLVIVLSDHGEEFREHGRWRHGNHLHAEALNVPLIVRFPRQGRGRRVAAPVQHADVMPTVLDVLGLPPATGIEGRSLLPWATDSAGAGAAGPIFSHLRLGRGPLQLSVVEGEWKLIRRREESGAWSAALYQWTTDPGEGRDRAADLPVRTAVLATLLEEHWQESAEQAPAQQVALDAEIERSLRELGYLP